MGSNGKIKNIIESVSNGVRLTPGDAVLLLKHASSHELGRAANDVRERFHKNNKVTFVIDRNINYTNVCLNRCAFCAFYRDAYSPDAYLLNCEDILAKVKEAVSEGGTQIMLQGGLNPETDIDYFTEIFSAIKERFDVTIHSLSPPEIKHIADISGLSLKDTLRKLVDAGLDSLPGAGAEVLSDNVRKRISPLKMNSSEWLKVMRVAQEEGLYCTATMMFGIGEDIEERVSHLDAIRSLQDENGRFRAFIPWTFQPGHTKINLRETNADDYLRTVAVSRIFLDNISNIQGSWLTQGEAIGQISLFFGANDLGSTMLEENVVRATGVHRRMSINKIVGLVKDAGYQPAQRDTKYNIIKEY